MEGDATLLMTRWYAENTDPGRVLGDVAAMLRQNITKLREAPPYLREMLLFPYQQGQEFAMSLYCEGGTAALDDVFRHPPRSTQQILHPDQFLRQRQDPVAVEVPRVDAKDWRLIGNNVVGEFGIRSLLQQQLSAWEAQLVAQGWRGDRYHAYERGPTGPTAVIWVSVWDNEQSAAEFEDAYRKLEDKRAPTPAPVVKITRVGERVTVQRAAEASFPFLSNVTSGQ
jgi:hypothetical protein